MALKALHLHFIHFITWGRAFALHLQGCSTRALCAQPPLPQSTPAPQGWSPTRSSVGPFTIIHQHLDGKLQMFTPLNPLALGLQKGARGHNLSHCKLPVQHTVHW